MISMAYTNRDVKLKEEINEAEEREMVDEGQEKIVGKQCGSGLRRRSHFQTGKTNFVCCSVSNEIVQRSV